MEMDQAKGGLQGKKEIMVELYKSISPDELFALYKKTYWYYHESKESYNELITYVATIRESDLWGGQVEADNIMAELENLRTNGATEFSSVLVEAYWRSRTVALEFSGLKNLLNTVKSEQTGNAVAA